MTKKILTDIVKTAFVVAGLLTTTAGTSTAQITDKEDEQPGSRSTVSPQNNEEYEGIPNRWSVTYTIGKNLGSNGRILTHVPKGAIDVVDSQGTPHLVSEGLVNQLDLEWTGPDTKLKLRGNLATANEPYNRAVISGGIGQLIFNAVSANVGLLQRIRLSEDGKSLYVGGDIGAPVLLDSYRLNDRGGPLDPGIDPLRNIVATFQIGYMNGDFLRNWSAGGGVRSVKTTYATSNDIIRGNDSQRIYTEDHLIRTLLPFARFAYSDRTEKGDLNASITLEFPDKFLYTRGESFSGRETSTNYSRSPVLKGGLEAFRKIPGLPLQAGANVNFSYGRLTPLNGPGSDIELFGPVSLVNTTVGFSVRLPK